MSTWILLLSACGGRSVEALPLPTPSVALGDLHADHEVDLSGFRDEVERNTDHLRRCWEARAPELPLQEGSVSIHAQIDPTGAVTEQCLGDDSFQDPGLRQCVNDLIAMGRYPTGTPADVTFTFLFSSSNG